LGVCGGKKNGACGGYREGGSRYWMHFIWLMIHKSTGIYCVKSTTQFIHVPR
jgi:hypothetical protein